MLQPQRRLSRRLENSTHSEGEGALQNGARFVRDLSLAPLMSGRTNESRSLPWQVGLALAYAVTLAGCEGSVGGDVPVPGTTAGTGATSTATGGAATGGTGPVDPITPGELNTPYTRLTRDEYQATIQAAFGVEAPVSGMPNDEHIGPFTANVASPDPAQQFLLASEDLAEALVPALFPVCSAATATSCIQTSYQPAIERLYRRPLSAAELAGLATVITSAESSGLSAQEATRLMVVSTLLSPSFLFRSSPISGDGARARRLVEHLSYALWDEPPDVALVSAGQVPAADLGAALKEQAIRLGTDAKAVPVLARFLAQWLAVELDAKLSDPNLEFEKSPLYAELLAITQEALTTNKTVKSFVNGNDGFIQKDAFATYGVPPVASSTEVVPVPWGASPRRGLLGQEIFMDATRNPVADRREIYRGHVVRSNLLCQPIPSPPPNATDLADSVPDRTKDTRCTGCHSLMDPIGRAFAPFDLDNTFGSPAPVVNGGGEVTGTFASLPEMLDKIAESQAYADCFSRFLLGFFLEQNPESVDAASVADLAAVVKSGGSLADVVVQAVVSLEARSRATTPWCSAL